MMATMRLAVLVFCAAIGGCSRCARPSAERDVPASAAAASETATGPARAAEPRGSAPGPARAVRVYVAGESIERRVRWIEAPLLGDGRLNDRGERRNDDDEYGWVVPFAERLQLRAPGLTVTWAGTDRWLGHDDEAYDGTFPAGGPGATSAISGTSIEGWLEQRRGELEAKKHCYDLAIAARGGNDFENDDDSVGSQLRDLVRLLAHGSSCRAAPLVVVTAHMPDDQRFGKGPDDGTYVAQQRHRFVDRFRAAAEDLGREGLAVRFVDLYTPFVRNQPTTAFPGETWSNGGIPDYAKIGREGDRMHPRRLASIYAGELVADGIDLAALPGAR